MSPSLPPGLTGRQRQVLDFMRAFFAENDQLPTMQAIAAHFGWKSANAAACFANILEGKGYIEKNAVGRYRFCRTQPAEAPAAGLLPDLLRLPVRAQAGIPVQRFLGGAPCS